MRWLTPVAAGVIVALTPPATQALSFDWVAVEDPGNAGEVQSQGVFGGVDYTYRISKHEVTNAQYAQFLNAVDPTGANALSLYDSNMSGSYGGISNLGTIDGARYMTLEGRKRKPVVYVSFVDAMRFVNWLNNGQGSETESGVYAINDGLTETRSATATYFLPSENEWYKAAYYDPRSTVEGGPPGDSHYWNYPTRRDTAPIAYPPICSNCANYNGVVGDSTDVGAYRSSTSYYGTFDQGGNVWEWNESVIEGQLRGVRGGSWSTSALELSSAFRLSDENRYPPLQQLPALGFRVASAIPDPKVRYHFTTIADTSDPRFSSFAFNGTPAINNGGTVVFGATLTDGKQAIYALQDGELTTVVDTTGQFSELLFEEFSINSAEELAFRASYDTGGGGIFKVSGGAVTTIADTTGPLGIFKGVSINDSGAVAFYAAGQDSEKYEGVYVGQGGPLTTIAEHRASDSEEVVAPSPFEPSINNHGDVAFFGHVASTGNDGIFVGNGNLLTQLVEEAPPYSNMRPERRCPITDSGAVAFVANGFDDELRASVRGVYRYSEGEVERIIAVEYPSETHDLSDVMINEAGTVAFGRDSPPFESVGGVYTGPDPVADKVIAYGDLLDGAPVRLIRFWGQGLNDRGQVAFYAETESGAGIYLATPIPEPSTMLLGLASTLVFCVASRRRTPREE